MWDSHQATTLDVVPERRPVCLAVFNYHEDASWVDRRGWTKRKLLRPIVTAPFPWKAFESQQPNPNNMCEKPFAHEFKPGKPWLSKWEGLLISIDRDSYVSVSKNICYLKVPVLIRMFRNKLLFRGLSSQFLATPANHNKLAVNVLYAMTYSIKLYRLNQYIHWLYSSPSLPPNINHPLHGPTDMCKFLPNPWFWGSFHGSGGV